MTEQLHLVYDAALGERLADAGMEQAAAAERVQLWKTAAAAWIAEQDYGDEFTADDLVRAVGLPDQGVNRNNVVGAVFSAASRTGKITFAGRMRKSARASRHSNVQRVWIRS